jgi:ABC-type transport system involved in multi-copper enzyme maturation permease subunit
MMLVAIFIVLCAILVVLILMLPVETRRALIGSVKFLFWMAVILVVGFFAVTFAYSFIVKSGGVIVTLHRVPWYVWVLLFVGVVFIAGLSDWKVNKKIRTGDPEAIEERVETLMNKFSYTREQAEAAVDKIRRT